MNAVIILFKKLWELIANSRAIQYAALLLLAFGACKKSAKKEQKSKQLEAEIKHIQTAMEQKNEAEQKSDSLSSDTIDQRMRGSGWLRD